MTEAQPLLWALLGSLLLISGSFSAFLPVTQVVRRLQVEVISTE